MWMSDAMERNCNNCDYTPCVLRGSYHSLCISHRFPEEVPSYDPSIVKSPVTFVDKIKAALPKEEKFSLDKLIDDHWKYNEGLVKLCFPYGVDGWETDDILRLVEFAYKQSGKHFWKHCKEHYNIEGE